MKNDAVSSISERIISIIANYRNKSKGSYMQIGLRNIGGCKGTKMKLQLLIQYDEVAYREVVSDCLSPDEIGKIHEAVQSCCNQMPRVQGRSRKTISCETIISVSGKRKKYSTNTIYAKILLSSAAAAALTYALITQLTSFTSLTQLIIGVAVFTTSYLIAAILTKTFNTTDINNLREMFSALGPLQRLFNTIMNLIEKLMTILRANSR